MAGTDECACCGPDAPRGHYDLGACVASCNFVDMRQRLQELSDRDPQQPVEAYLQSSRMLHAEFDMCVRAVGSEGV